MSSAWMGSLQEHTWIFGLRLWIVVLVVLFIMLLTLFFCCFLCHYRRQKAVEQQFRLSRPYNMKGGQRRSLGNALSSRRRLLSFNTSEVEREFSRKRELEGLWSSKAGAASVVGDVEAFGVRLQPANIARTLLSVDEVEAATCTFALRNLIGYGDSGVVYRGVLFNGTRVAVKRLLNNCSYGNDEELKLELDDLTNITHRNIVKLLGFCLEGDDRMLIYEYIDNDSLYRWLHVRGANASALTWDRRMAIIHGTARGLAYLHEGINPGIVHGNIKSSNIVLDQQWNPKISDIGSALPFGPQRSPSNGSPEVGSEDIAADKSIDVYCFGMLIMEIVTGRLPVDENQPQAVHLIDSVKCMIANQEVPRLLDPRITDMPPLKDLKRILLIALMCVDPDLHQRPEINSVVSMLETPNLVLIDNTST